MDAGNKFRIGELLVEEGAVSAEQLRQALENQKRQKQYKPLGEICVELNFLSRTRLHRILNKHRKGISLGDLLINLGLITPEQLKKGLEQQKKSSEKLGVILVNNGYINEYALVDALSVQMGILKMDPDFNLIDQALLKGINEEFLLRNEIIPVLKGDGDALTVIMSNPLDRKMIESLERLFRVKKIIPAIASATDIKRAVRQHFQKDSFPQKPDSGAKKKALIIGDSQIQAEAGDNTTGIVNYIITNAILEGASDIHIEPGEEGIRVKYRIDGILRHKTDLPVSLAPSIASRIKILCRLDIAERRRHQDGRIQAQIMDKEVDMRVSVYASAFGENIVIRILHRKTELIDIERLGLSPRNENHLMRNLEQPTGVILVTGPTGSGKTTTLYAAMNHLNDGRRSIITVEDPIEYVMDGVVQGQLNPGLGQTYVDFIKSMMRQDPDVIMVGEIRDGTAAEAVIQCALTGHKVLSTFHTEDTTGALLRLMDMGIDTFLISSTVVSVIAQRLVRVLCDECKEEYAPDVHQLDALGVRAGNIDKLKFHRSVGCPRCTHTGYRGRTGVHELLIVNDTVRDAILARKTSGEIRRIARESADLMTMREDGFCKVFKGITSFEEIGRVVPWHEIDDDFYRSPEEILHMWSDGPAFHQEDPKSNGGGPDGGSGTAHGREKIYRIRFNTRTIAREKDRIAMFFKAYRRMVEKTGQTPKPSGIMEDFVDFILFTTNRVESSLKSRFIEFSLLERDGRIVIALETMVPCRPLSTIPRKVRDRSPRLTDFLHPPAEKVPHGGDGPFRAGSTSAADDRSGGPVLSTGSSETPFPGDEKIHQEKTGLYRRHVEELRW